uniref:Cytochrome n=1 Tax=Lutzomyia longipalpis TaxID=7200 RepID=A0A1B0CES9_LUTLO
MWSTFIVILCFFLVIHLWQNRTFYRLVWQMPGPSLWFFNKNFSGFNRGIPRGNIFFRIIKECLMNYKTPLRCWIGTTFYIILEEPEDIKTVLNSQHCLNHPFTYEFVKPFFGNGLSTISTPQWNVHRKLLNSTFNTKIFKSYLPIFNKESKVLVSRLEELCNKKELTDISLYTKAVTYDTVYHTTLNREINTQKNQNFHLLECSNKVAAMCGERIFNALYYWDSIYHRTSHYKELKKNEQIIREPTIKGYETTGNALAYCILMLGMFPEHQGKMYEEIKSVMLDESQDIQWEDLGKCNYIERFIKEILRLFPSAPLTSRKSTETIQLGKYIVPANTNFLLPLFLLHRDKEFWGPTAEDFDPDRFLPENVKSIHPYAYLPFSGGPRICPGIKYAHMILKTILIRTVRKFKFRTDLKMADLEFEFDITLNIMNKHMVYVEKEIIIIN